MAQARSIGSLPVPNVQALAEACNGLHHRQAVPERYIRTEEVRSDEVVAGGGSAIPVIDLSKLLDPRTASEEKARLASAALHWGFFQLVNHGVPAEVMANLMNDTVEFFKLPLEAKNACSQLPGSLEGYGQAFVMSEEQKLDWADMLYLQVLPTESRDMRIWPTQPPSFRHSVDAYSSATAEVACRLLGLMAEAVGVEAASLRDLFQGQVQGIRFNYYPPCRQAADSLLGLSPHSDTGGLTVLLQMNGVRGLQVRNKDGRWVAVDAMDGALVVNVGDTLEVLSNGKFRSVEHRAVIHPEKERISVAAFHYAPQDLPLAPLPEFVKDGDRVRYRTTTFNEFMTQFLAAKLDGKRHLETLKLD